MSIGAVLPLKVSGSYGVDDLNRTTILFKSLQAFAEPGLFSEFWVVVPANEVEQVQKALARWQHLPIKVTAEDELLPELKNYPKMRGWRKQQLVKLAIANRMQSRFYMTFDADVICLKPVTEAQLIIDGKALLQYEQRAQHPKWWKSSARLLNMSPDVGDTRIGMTVTPAIMATDLCKAVMNELTPQKAGKNWVDAIGELHDPANPKNWWPGRYLKLKWTEYSLYYLCAHKRGLLDQYHVTAGTTEFPQRLLVHESHPYESWDTDYSFSQRCPGLFCVVGSKTGLAPSTVMKRLEPYIGQQ